MCFLSSYYIGLLSQSANRIRWSPGPGGCWIFHQYKLPTTLKAREESGCHPAFELQCRFTNIGNRFYLLLACLCLIYTMHLIDITISVEFGHRWIFFLNSKRKDCGHTWKHTIFMQLYTCAFWKNYHKAQWVWLPNEEGYSFKR